MWNREHVLTGRSLARRPLSARRVHVKMTSHVAQCIHNKSYCADRDVCRFSIWTKGYREHSTVLAIWTLVYQELVSRTFCWGRGPRTYMNRPVVTRPCISVLGTVGEEYETAKTEHNTEFKKLRLVHFLKIVLYYIYCNNDIFLLLKIIQK